MKAEKILSICAERKNNLITTIHPNDTMYSSGKDWYWSVGESAINVILSVLLSAPLTKVSKVLDFGCGYGRVGRQLRLFFPDAEILFSDLNSEAEVFCCNTFSGSRVTLDTLPSNIDVIWLGSVFTHIDFSRAKQMFNTLTKSLSRGGVIIVTTHGRRAIVINNRSRYISQDKWSSIYEGYKAQGAGYASYGRPDLGDYGVSLFSVDLVCSMGEGNDELRLISYQEAGWSNHQDVAAWTKWSLSE